MAEISADAPRVKMSTEVGDVVIELHEDEAPNTVANFITLVESGHYDNLNFHRVVDGFVAQGGCPEGTGMGGPGYCIPFEAGKVHDLGAVAMARTQDPDSAGCQFYFVLNPQTCAQLNGSYSVFGQIVEGLENIEKIEVGTKINKAEVLNKRDHAYEVQKLPGK